MVAAAAFTVPAAAAGADDPGAPALPTATPAGSGPQPSSCPPATA
ncbi:hypothetical protein ACFQ9X_27560 [Catenulispora yoronensis]